MGRTVSRGQRACPQTNGVDAKCGVRGRLPGAGSPHESAVHVLEARDSGISVVAGERYHLYRTVIMWSSERAIEAKRRRRLDQYHGDVELIGRDLRPAIGETRIV
jgi:hypothetical protein